MMLLLPPGMVAENFDGMMGFTLRGKAGKNFEVRVQRGPNVDEDRFPVRLMVEYGEMLKDDKIFLLGRNPSAFVLSLSLIHI